MVCGSALLLEEETMDIVQTLSEEETEGSAPIIELDGFHQIIHPFHVVEIASSNTLVHSGVIEQFRLKKGVNTNYTPPPENLI